MVRLSESLVVRRQLRDARGICDCIGVVAVLQSRLGNHSYAAMLLSAAEMGKEAAGYRPVPWLQSLLDEAAASAKDSLASEYLVRHSEGRDLTVDRAVELILTAIADVPAEAPIGNQVRP